MKHIIKAVLDDMSNGQINLGSNSARKMVSTLISTALESKGCYTEYGDSEIEEQKARDSWVCSICGENTADVDYDYIGSGTNHLGCELKSQEDIDEYIEDIDEQAYAQGRKSSVNENDDSDYYTGPESKTVQTLDDGGGITFREKNWLQKKHEDKVFGHDQGGNYEMPEGLKRAKELSQEALEEGLKQQGHRKYPYNSFVRSKEDLQKQAYVEMTSDGLPEGGDAQAVLESHKLAEEIVEAQEGTWIYESPDGGKTVFRRPFSDYDPKNKEEIDWKTKEPTGRKFTEYNNGNWSNEDEG
jgi:hypothetical protein